MDPLSQGLLGAAAAMAVARRPAVGRAGLLGAFSGMAPDLDVLVRSSSDPLLFLEVHRQFSHALAFIPVGALLSATLLHPLMRPRLAFRETLLYCLLGYATHGLLDGCTSYGTQLLWPFSDRRVAWNVVSVVDPLFTIPLAGGLLAAALRRGRGWARVGLAWAVGYLLLGLVQRERAESFALEVALASGRTPVAVSAKPAFGNLLLWKTFYELEGRFYVDAARMGAVPRSFAGQSVARLDLARDLPWLAPGSQQARDIERFRRFSSGYVSLDPAHPDRIIDVRYSMVPNRIRALWGLQLDPGAAPEAHASFVTSREVSRADREALLGMLGGDAREGEGQGAD